MIKGIQKQNYYPSYTIQFSFKELIGTDNGLLTNMYTSPYVSICWLIARLLMIIVCFGNRAHLFNEL